MRVDVWFKGKIKISVSVELTKQQTFRASIRENYVFLKDNQKKNKLEDASGKKIENPSREVNLQEEESPLVQMLDE